MVMLSKEKIEALQKKILMFYKTHGRKLPWRETTDRYAIMVSEIMLQQTQVDRVIPKFQLWMVTFPTIKSLACASVGDVLTLWSGLGYNSRAKRLHDAAGFVVQNFEGIIPDHPDVLLKLPGIGPYTARSILIFADNKDLATVDTNIRRILIHEFQLPEDIAENELFAVAEQVLPKGKSRDWHNALMDYGSLVLTSKKSGIKPVLKQSKFKGSKRWYRGKIMGMLAKEKSLSVGKIKAVFAGSPHEWEEVMQDLQNGGLVKREGNMYLLP